MREFLRENWRLLVLVLFVAAATFALFHPSMAPETEVSGENPAAASAANLQFGLDLAGGTRIRAPLQGFVAEDVDYGGDSELTVAGNVAAELPGTDSTDVNARPPDPEEGTGAVEVTDPEVTEAEFEAALEAAGYQYGSTRAGVFDETRETAVRIIEAKINEAGLSGGSARTVRAGFSGEWFVLVEAPGEQQQDVIDLIQERGTVRIDIYHPDGNGSYATEREALTREEFDDIGTAQRTDDDQAYVPVSVVSDAPEGQEPPNERFQRLVNEHGLSQPGGSRCTYDVEAANVSHPDRATDPSDLPETDDPCLLLVVDDEVVNAFGMDETLAEPMRNERWANDPSFRLTTGVGGEAFERAQEVSLNLRAGALPARLDIGSGTVFFVTATQGEEFRLFGLIIGVLAVFAVAGMVFLRYREPEVALPMTVTALSEVYLLLGFAALVEFPIDLAVVAGFIAVVGTGVDDLVIIADEVMSEGDVNSRTVFDSRFKRAFWVIGAAAATTIIAMSPLMVLSLGDLSGFAIFTILGVLAGVLITRPAYGDILRRRLTEG